MSAYGFVYLLGNPAMPCYYKIGSTQGSPHSRARELSAASGVPRPFVVALYIECTDCRAVEKRLHMELGDYRATNQREFFCFGPAHMDWLWHVFETHPRALSFSCPGWNRFSNKPSFPDSYVDTWVDDGEYLHLSDAAPLQDLDLLRQVGKC